MVINRQYSDSSEDENIPQQKKIMKKTEQNFESLEDMQTRYWDLNVYKKLKVNIYKGKSYIDFREYFFDKDGKPAPTKKGVQFPIEDLD